MLMISSVHQQRYQSSGSNNNVDIKFSANDVSSKRCGGETSIFPEAQPKGIYIVSRECHIIYPV
jgi:hypothetical protein